MCQPILESKDPARTALAEIVSAMSALNMEPDPILEPTGPYLSQRDHWAAHSMEHLKAAFDYVVKANNEIEALKGRIYRLEKKK